MSEQQTPPSSKSWNYPQHKNNVCPQFTGENGPASPSGKRTGLDGIAYVSHQQGSLRVSCGIDHPQDQSNGWKPYPSSADRNIIDNRLCGKGGIELKDLSNGVNGSYKCVTDLTPLKDLCSNISDSRGFSYRLILDEDNVHRCAWVPKPGMGASFEPPKAL
jgi:hypothetical protein